MTPDPTIRYYVVKAGGTVAIWPAREDQITALLEERGGELIISYGKKDEAEDARRQLLRPD